jgi:hypothetical protein
LSSGISASVPYNRSDERIALVGALNQKVIVKLPRDLVDFTELAQRHEIKISGRIF